jgi:hypothetical protein
MANRKLSGTTEISDEGIKKHFKTFDSWQALFELTWNGLDARAKKVSIEISENDMHGVECVTVLDDGDGIDIEQIKENFGKFNDSSKKEDVALHGLHGRGRLAFHKLAHEATWWTRSSAGDAVIHVRDVNIKHYDGDYVEPAEQFPALVQQKSGTCVVLTGVHTNLPTAPDLQHKFSAQFGWYLALNTDREIKINNVSIVVPSHDIHTKIIDIGNIAFVVKVIRWFDKPGSEQSYIYLLDSSGKVQHKQYSSFNRKVNFHTSVYVQSDWADTFSREGDDLFRKDAHTTESESWKKLNRLLNEFIQEIYDEFLRNFVDAEIAKYEDDGIFPVYDDTDKNYASWRAANTKSLVKLVYMSDPTVMTSLNKKQKKIIVRLLDRISVSNENDALFNILNEVLDLDGPSLEKFSGQLRHTQLEHIISTIEVLQQRQTAVRKLKDLMNNHYKIVLETPDLQQIIENNTWLFGHRYETIGAEEDTFTKIAKSLREKVKYINDVDSDDFEDDAEIDGANRQTDLFLARKIPALDSFGKKYYRCIVIEIKRPSIALNIKHLRQLDDYANIIKKHPEFSSEHIRFELILIGRKISQADTEINSRLQGQIHKSDMGLVSDDGAMKRYVMNWYTLLDGFELAHSHLLEVLKLRRESFASWTKQELVEDLQSSEISTVE